MINVEFMDFYVQYCAARTDDRIAMPKTGPTDDWVNERMKKYAEMMSNREFIDFIKIIKSIAEKKFEALSDSSFIIFGVVNEAIYLRDTKKKSEKHFDETATIIDLSEEEEKELVEIIRELQKKLPDAHKYRADSFIKRIKGIQ